MANPLEVAEVIVIDMEDLAWMSALITTLPTHAATFFVSME